MKTIFTLLPFMAVAFVAGFGFGGLFEEWYCANIRKNGHRDEK